jgi:hypothetical protein
MRTVLIQVKAMTDVPRFGEELRPALAEDEHRMDFSERRKM